MADQRTKAPPEQRLALSIKEFCERTGISRATLYRLAARGGVVLRKLGYRTVVPIAEVERLLGVGGTSPATSA